MEKGFYSPAEISDAIIELGYKKSNTRGTILLVLSILAGAFVALAAQGSNVAVLGIESLGPAKVLSSAVFTVALMLVIIAGAELFTGNNLIVISCLTGKSKWAGLFKNWIIVYTGNFIGSLLVVFLILKSGQLNLSDGLLGGISINNAVNKTNLNFGNAFILGVLCNWLVCLAVWMAYGARDITGKILAIFFPIWLFSISGFEHSVANMYHIPMGILAKSNGLWAGAAKAMGVTGEQLVRLNIKSFLVGNLIPVTLGNIVGGVVFVAIAYWYTYQYCKDKE